MLVHWYGYFYESCVVSTNAFDRWIIVDVANEMTAWSGSRFVPITDEGFPASNGRVSNLDTLEGAAEYAASFRFDVVDTIVN
jgi:hypothetical protein